MSATRARWPRPGPCCSGRWTGCRDSSRDLILLAKSDRPDFLNLSEADPADLVTSVLAKARALGDRRWLLDAETHATNGHLVVVDEQRLTQALLQFADNAVKHTAPGQEIAIGASLDVGTLHLWVRDTGQGVKPQDRERIFQRFGRAEVTHGDEGFGLGLSIVSAIAHAHGGSAYVDDPPGGTGARFVIRLPAVRPETRATPAKSRPRRSGRRRMASILIIEDEHRIASFIGKGLRAEGHTALAVADGPTGLDHALSGNFDLVVLDIGLPGMDGFELARPFRAHRVPASRSSC